MSKDEDEISVNDLLQDLNDTENFGDLKNIASKQAKPLLETSQASQDRANRHAAYEEVVNESEKWRPIVREIEKQRTITFGAPDHPEKKRSKRFRPVKSELAQTITSILDEQKLTPKAQATLEDEQNAKLSEQELKERALRLANLRRLQFYNEEKARRWKKIKSKAFRRLHKRDMAPIPLEELAETDPEQFQRELAKVEAKRAKERVTLRHKNTSQWVRRVLARGLKSATEEEKRSYEDQLKLGEELMKKIKIKKRNADDDDESEYEEEEEGNETGTGKEEEIKKQEDKLSGLLNMKFMRDAREKKEHEMEEMKKLLKEQESGETPSTGIVTISSKPTEKKQKKTGKTVSANGDDYVEDDVDQKAKDEMIKESGQTVEKKVTFAKKENEEEIQEPEGATAAGQEEEIKKKTSPFKKAKKPHRKTVNANTLILQQPTEEELTQITDSVEFGKKEGQEEILNEMLGYQTDFEKEKEELAVKEASENLPSMDELHLEGWGSWTGPGVKPSAKAERRKQAIEKERQRIIEEAKAGRKDANLNGVILSEEAFRPVEKYAITEIPHAYSNPKQVKAQLSYPIGPEFNSVSGFKQLIKPDMITKAGAAIEPVFMSKMNRRKERIVRMKQQRKALDSSKSLQ